MSQLLPLMRRKALWLGLVAVVSIASLTYLWAAETPWTRLAQQVEPLHKCLTGKQDAFHFQADCEVEIDGKPQSIQLQLIRYHADAYDFACLHQDYAVLLKRRPDQTVLTLPLHKKQFVGTGNVNGPDQLAPENLLRRLISSDSECHNWLTMLDIPLRTCAMMVSPFATLDYIPESQEWLYQKSFKISAQPPKAVTETAAADQPNKNWEMQLSDKRWQARLSLQEVDSAQESVTLSEEFETVPLDRQELERQLVRGVRRAAAILAPSKRLTNPPQISKKVSHGELRWIDQQRVVLLSGTPEQMGKAHAELLTDEATRCMDSVLATFGTFQTIRTGRWFRHDLEEAYARLAPHIPEHHLREMTALGEGLGWEPELVRALNVFPELFHCSGFAVFDSATADGTLYHGRVLDYMTTIGLQDAATTFIMAPEGKFPFANVGYGGFTGSVSGMNAVGISLGEMGGRGEGQWDGVPMATLMRRALEECETLAEVKRLWTDNPRTCEYYYVFADGKTHEAVGVAATPEKVEFIDPGQAHPLLGEGIPDTLVLSAGKRLETLRQRVQEKHGKIDTETALWLMSRPVAMSSNLHNVLFVPEQGLLYVANADHKHPAADRPYVKIDLKSLLAEFQPPEKPEPVSEQDKKSL